MKDIERELRRIQDVEKQMAPIEEARRHEEMMRPLREMEEASRFANLVPNIPMPDLGLGAMHKVLEAQAEAMAETQEAPTARRAISQLLNEIRQFEAALDDHSEVGVKLAPFGNGAVIHVSEIGFRQPSLVVLVGALEDGSPVKLVQHLSQLNLLLVRAPRLHPEMPKQPIGFRPVE